MSGRVGGASVAIVAAALSVDDITAQADELNVLAVQIELYRTDCRTQPRV
jgi:hypothetical protein